MRVRGCGACRVARGWCPCVGTLVCTAQTWKLPCAGALRAPKMLLAHVCLHVPAWSTFAQPAAGTVQVAMLVHACGCVCTLPSSTSTCAYVLVDTWAHTGASRDTPPSPAPHLEVGMVHPAQTLWKWKVPYIPQQAVVVQGAQGSPSTLPAVGCAGRSVRDQWRYPWATSARLRAPQGAHTIPLTRRWSVTPSWIPPTPPS